MATQCSRPGATIIAFPGSPGMRLALALAKLDAALGAQRTAMEDFHRSLVALGNQVDGLEQGLVRYRTKLGTIGTAIAGLRQQVNKLDTLADGGSPRSSA